MTAKPGIFIDSLSSAERKECAVSRGLFAYFPDALALIARHSVRSNEKHNPGQPVGWTREKSADHEDCIGRHSLSIAIDPNSLDGDEPHIVCRAWRALAALQVWAEAQKAKANDGWTEHLGHSGSECPVALGALVDVKLRSGAIARACLAASLNWRTRGMLSTEIVAYRVVG